MDRRVQKTKAAIREAYMSLITQNRSKKITISDIAATANIDRKTFYCHYDCVDDILREFWEERLQELLGTLRQTDYFQAPIKLLIVYKEMNRIIERDMSFYRQLATNVNFAYFWNQIRQMMVDALIDAYSARISLPEPEMRMYCDFMAAGIIHLYQDYLRDPNPESEEMMGRIIVDIVQQGATTLLKNVQK